MEQTFEEIVSECHKDRLREEYWEQYNLDNRARQEYAKFCCWCRAFKNGEFTENNFKEYQEQEKLRLNFWIKKRIAKLFFGYKFIFNHNANKWFCGKNNDA